MDADWIHMDSDILNIYFFVFSGMEANQICMDTLKILEIYFGVFFPFPSLYSLFFLLVHPSVLHAAAVTPR